MKRSIINLKRALLKETMFAFYRQRERHPKVSLHVHHGSEKLPAFPAPTLEPWNPRNTDLGFGFLPDAELCAILARVPRRLSAQQQKAVQPEKEHYPHTRR